MKFHHALGAIAALATSSAPSAVALLRGGDGDASVLSLEKAAPNGGSSSGAYADAALPTRDLMEEHNMFMPLGCNSDVDAADCSTSLESLVSGAAGGGGDVKIDCGTCVTLTTTDGSTLDLPAGLNVEGKLHVPSSARAVLRTTHVIVQGVLKIDPPDASSLAEGPAFKVLLKGDDDVVLGMSNLHPDNAMACMNGCNMHEKPIVVAGGRLDVTGDALAASSVAETSSCPSWTSLLDVGVSSLPTFNDAAPPCRVGGGGEMTVSDGSFEDGTNHDVSPGNPGGFQRVHGGTLSIETEDDGNGGTNSYIHQTDRTWNQQGILVKLTPPEHCAVAGVPYKFRLRYRLDSPDKEETTISQMCWKKPDNSWSCKHILVNGNNAGGNKGWVYDERIVTFTEEQANAIYIDIKFNFRGGTGDADYDDIYFGPAIESTPPDQLVVSPSVAQCWSDKVGSKVLVTSSVAAGDWDGHEERTISAVDGSTGVITLDGDLSVTPVTAQDDPRFPAEVALLGRATVFEAETNTLDPDRGGHLIVLHTMVPQSLKGVELVNFGQQGQLGRYPIHFHMCSSSPGSVVTKNVVTGSNQRCIVIHGTHQVLVDDNVAFDTKGHCFIVEDGSEEQNTFRRNLGAYTQSQAKTIGASDNEASTFWITNPNNYFEDNVAAGSQMTGFWFETESSVGGSSAMMEMYANVNPKKTALGSFIGNVAHSNSRHGMQTYSPGYQPTTEALFKDLKSYKNSWFGLFVHGTKNLHINGGVLADNWKGIMNNNPKTIVNGTTIIVNSNHMRERHGQSYCHPRPDLYGFVTRINEATDQGAELHGVSFDEFDDASPCGEVAYSFMYHNLDKAFQERLVLKGVTTDAPAEARVHIPCSWSNDFGIDNIAVEIPDDSNMGLTDRPGFYLSNHVNMKAFVDELSCTVKAESCAKYCPDVCLRQLFVTTSSDPAYQDYKLVIDDGTDRVLLDRTPTLGRYETVLLAGTYDITFEDAAGQPAWPLEAYVILGEAPICDNHVRDEDVTLTNPFLPPDHDFGILLGDGTATSRSLMGFEKRLTSELSLAEENGNYYFSLTNRDHPGSGITMWMDPSKVVAGQEYRFSAKYRLHSPNDKTDYNIAQLNYEVTPGVWKSRHTMSSWSYPPAGGGLGWVTMEVTGLFFTAEEAEALQMRMHFTWRSNRESPKWNYFDSDYDDIEFGPVSGPVSL